MKNIKNIVAVALLLSTTTYAQKDELKSLRKIYEKEKPSLKDVTEYRLLLSKAEPLVANATDEDKLYFEYYSVGTPLLELGVAMQKPENQANPAMALKFFTADNIAKITAASEKVLNFEKKNGKLVFTKDILEDYATFKPMVLNYAIALGNEKKYSDAASVLYSVYLMDKKDTDKLYYAANYAINAVDYDTALKYYNELIAMKYTGESVIYYAKNLANGIEESFPDKASRDNFVRLKTHTTPRDEKIPSKLGEIYKNIALIYVSQKKFDEAKSSLTDARAKNPDDVSLIMTEANLYLELKDDAMYKKLVAEVLEKNPNDVDLIYNLGVISAKTNTAEAEKYYLRVIQLDGNYLNAYLNLAILKLDGEKPIVTQMNKLGTTAADNKKYDVLKVQRQNIFKSAIPYLEKCVELDPKNYEAAKTLLNVYNALDFEDKAKALKVKVKEMEANMKS
jgi:tetratricopeptide (TPR) repeat protein